MVMGCSQLNAGQHRSYLADVQVIETKSIRFDLNARESSWLQRQRALIRERQREGIALAKAKGVCRKGRQKALTAEQVAELRQRAAAGEKRTKLAKAFGISRPTLYGYLA